MGKRRRVAKSENSVDEAFRRTKKYRDQIVVSAQTEGQKKYIIAINNNDIIFCTGPAGTGKTAVAVGIALQHVCAASPTYDRLVVMRPAKEACDEKLGALPGTLEEKMNPWAAPIFDNMEVFVSRGQIRNLIWEKRFDVIPLAYARGRSLNNAFVIVDEAQNLSSQQVLMVLTRLGKNSKMVLNGDLRQSDIRQSGLTDAIQRLQGIDGIEFVEMDATDIVRHPLIAKILSRYEQ